MGLIAGEYPPMQGGLGDYTREVTLALARAGHEPHVLTLTHTDAPSFEQMDGVHVHRIMPAWDWRTGGRIMAFHRERPLDVVNLQYQAAAYQMHPAINLLPRWLNRRIPTLVTFHDLKVPYLFPKAGPLRRKAVLAMAKGAAASVVTNVEDAEDLAREGISNVHQIPIGSNIAPTDLAGFDEAAWRYERGIANALTLIGYFGFMNESKGGETLVRGLAELRRRDLNVGVLQIGGQTGASDPTNQAYAAHLKQLAQELGVAPFIFETGFVDARGVSEAFAACACVALPYRDGVSFRRGTLMAALVHGKAIVTTTPRVRLPEVRDEINMLLVPADEANALADGVSRVLNDAELRRRLEVGAYELSRRFGWEAIARALVNVFEKVKSARP